MKHSLWQVAAFVCALANLTFLTTLLAMVSSEGTVMLDAAPERPLQHSTLLLFVAWLALNSFVSVRVIATPEKDTPDA